MEVPAKQSYAPTTMPSRTVRSSVPINGVPQEPLQRELDDEVDETLIDLCLEQTISDRLRSLSNYVSGLARFRPV